jgi:hypothetical protein
MGEAAGLHAPGRVAVLGASFVDLDGDGDLDFLTGDYEGASRTLRAYRNESGAASNFLRLRLVGMGAGHSNVSAIGARVRVTAGGRTQTLSVKGGQGLSNVQNDLVLTFGLGSACEIDRVEVRWPDAAGTITEYLDVLANYLVVIHEGEPEPSYQPIEP